MHEHTKAATRGLPSLCRPTVRLLRSKCRIPARQTLYEPAKLTVEKLLDTRCATGHVVTLGCFNMLAAVGCRISMVRVCWVLGFGCNGDGCRLLTLTSAQVNMDGLHGRE